MKDAAEILDINYSTAKTIIRTFRLEKRISKKNCLENNSNSSNNKTKKMNKNKDLSKSKIFKTSRSIDNLNEKKLQSISSNSESKDDISKLRTELKPRNNNNFINFPSNSISTFNNINKEEKENSNESIYKSMKNEGIKTIMKQIFGNFIENLAKNVNNLPKMPIFESENFDFSKSEFFNFFRLINEANSIISINNSLSNNYFSNNDQISQSIHLLNLFLMYSKNEN